MDVDHNYVFTRLKESLQALACDAHVQRTALYPDFVCPTGELACGFGDWHRAVLANFREELTSDQLSSLEMLEQHLFGKGDELPREVWDVDQLPSHQYWQISRVLAKHTLRSFGWPLEIPPPHFGEFFRLDDTEENRAQFNQISNMLREENGQPDNIQTRTGKQVPADEILCPGNVQQLHPIG